VDYSRDTSYSSRSALDPTLTTSHAVTLTGLKKNTTYHYRVRSKNAVGTEVVSGDFTFRTTR